MYTYDIKFSLFILRYDRTARETNARFHSMIDVTVTN